jgi:formate-dependent phosphoribosylglycinamide formyltransferase (GAR transformylase)
VSLIELEAVAFLPAIELEAPGSTYKVVVSARALHYAVERDELRYDDPCHLVLLGSPVTRLYSM